MSAAITPEELAERGWEGASRCRCMTEDGYTACPPQMCEADQLLTELAELARDKEILVGLLSDQDFDEYRMLRGDRGR